MQPVNYTFRDSLITTANDAAAKLKDWKAWCATQADELLFWEVGGSIAAGTGVCGIDARECHVAGMKKKHD